MINEEDKKEEVSQEIITNEQRLGRHLVNRAQTAVKKEMEEKVLNKVANFIRINFKANIIIQQYQELVKFNQKKIDALNDGEFKYIGGSITFNDDKLNEEISTINEMREWLRMDS